MPGVAKALRPRRSSSSVVSPDRRHRIFFAIWPEAPVCDGLVSLVELAGRHCGGRPMRHDSLHLTLLFVGSVTKVQLESLQATAGSIVARPFVFELDRVGTWLHQGIVWAGCHVMPSCLRQLFIELRQKVASLDLSLDDRPFVPHVTLLRHAHCKGLPLLEQPIRWPVSEFALVESFLQPSGVRYRTLARWSLRQSA